MVRRKALMRLVGSSGRLHRHLHLLTTELPSLINWRLSVHALLLLHVRCLLGRVHVLRVEALHLHLLHHLLGDDLLLGRGALQILELFVVLIVFVDLGQKCDCLVAVV
jgi:hypothetical protein